MNTAFQSDSKSSNSGSNDNKSNQSTRQSPKPGPSSRTSNPYLHPSTFPASYDGVFLSDNNSFSFSSQYGYPSCNDQDEKHNHGTETLLPNVAQEPILTSCSQYPSGHTDHQQQFQSELHQQQLYQKQLQDHTLEQRSNYHQSHYPQNLVDCSDYDEDKGVEQDFPLEQTDHGLSQTTQRPPRPQSSYEVHSRNFISEEEFLGIAEDYLLSLSPKKREKALLTNSMYQKILMVLLQPKNTQISTAQFRFWAKKMFTLSTTETHHIVCHDGKPVATKECLYDVLVYCHRKSSHGGRDKTSAEVRGIHLK
ncbi:hypothetical protein BGZ76_009911 [Entomortierella beljakovae]|nr:hypothetical protein BGZ76_009911 [Entomortierella beljakovae]